jgi:hypothetical protein
MKGIQVLYDRQENLLANFLGVFAGQIMAELKDKAASRRVMKVEQFIPRRSLAAAATRQQFRLCVQTHAGSDCILGTGV